MINGYSIYIHNIVLTHNFSHRAFVRETRNKLSASSINISTRVITRENVQTNERTTNLSDSLVIPSCHADCNVCGVHVQVHSAHKRAMAMGRPTGGIPHVGGREVRLCLLFPEMKVGHGVAVRGWIRGIENASASVCVCMWARARVSTCVRAETNDDGRLASAYMPRVLYRVPIVELFRPPQLPICFLYRSPYIFSWDILWFQIQFEYLCYETCMYPMNKNILVCISTLLLYNTRDLCLVFAKYVEVTQY